MKNKPIRVLLIDDHSVVRLGIKALIENNIDLKVCGESAILEDAYKKTKELEPDVVLLDIKLPDGDGVIGCREIKKIAPDTKVIILTAYGNESLVKEVIKAGADGYLLKDIDKKTIISAIREVTEGKSALDPKVTKTVFDMLKNKNDLAINLTPQEENILDLINLGKTNKEIASELFIAEKTIRNYVSKIMKKLMLEIKQKQHYTG